MTDQAVFAPAWCAIIPLLGVLAIVALAWMFAKGGKGHAAKGESGDKAGAPSEDQPQVEHMGSRALACSKGTFAWLAVYAIALLAVAVACGMGLYADAVWKVVVFTLVDVALASVVAHRDRCLMVRKARAGSERLLRHAVCELGIILVVSYLTMWALECAYSDWAFGMAPQYQLMETVIILGFISVLYLLFGRRGAGAAIGVVSVYLIGLGQYFLYLFKLAPILPSDMMVLGTALAVSGNYDYVINGGVLQGAGFVLAALCLLSFAVPWKREGNPVRKYAFNLLSALIVFGLLAGFVCVPDYKEDADIKIDSWFTYDCYKKYGWLNSFITVAQGMVVEKPEGYTTEDAHDLVKETAAQYEKESTVTDDRAKAQEQFQEQQPAIVCVMNETFSDLSVYDNLRCDYEGPRFYNSLMEQTIVNGDCAVSVIGGGTCNSEFEFLTGNNMAFFGNGIYPYSAYKFDGCENLAKQFNELGYATTAIHPNFPTNWKRDVIYEKMGFGTLLSKDDFAGDDELVHNEVSDASTYKRVIELLETDESPQFIMDITMQNHSGYSRGGIPERYQVDYAPEGVDDAGMVDQINEYLGCIEASDDALRQFIADLEALDRPVLVVFFGDHQPGFSRDINDLFYPGESDAEHQQRIYQTSFFVWANYDVEGAERFADITNVTTSNLSALALEIAGVPLSDYQETVLQESKVASAYNAFGVCDAEGTWYDTDSGEVPEDLGKALDVLQRAQYLRFIDKDE